MKGKIKALVGSLFALGIVFGLSSCSGSKYTDGQVCGTATEYGDNTFSEIRRYYVEQYTYGVFYPAESYANAARYTYVDDKFIIQENTLVKLDKVQNADKTYSYSLNGTEVTNGHYLFTYYDVDVAAHEGADYKYNNDYYQLVDAYLTANVSVAKDIEDIKLELKNCANDATNGYFTKCQDMSKDGDSVKDATEADVTSVQSRMQSHSKACIVFEDNFADPATGVIVPKTTYGAAWNSGFLTGLLVYPLAWLLNFFVKVLGGTAFAQIAAIFIETIIIKLLILLFTFNSTKSTQKMQDVQPEILKIQAKYGQNPTPEQKQQMSYELMATYKKYGIKPFAPFISMFITFPVFIAMYRAVMYLGVLRTGSFLGITLGNTLSTYIIGNFNFAALVIFALMAGTQVLSMKIPQILNRKQMTREAKQQQSQANMMTNVMLIMILVMGFSMPVLMSIYWIASALVSSVQSVIMHKANNAGKNGKYKVKRVDNEPITIPQGYKTK